MKGRQSTRVGKPRDYAIDGEDGPVLHVAAAVAGRSTSDTQPHQSPIQGLLRTVHRDRVSAFSSAPHSYVATGRADWWGQLQYKHMSHTTGHRPPRGPPPFSPTWSHSDDHSTGLPKFRSVRNRREKALARYQTSCSLRNNFRMAINKYEQYSPSKHFLRCCMTL